MKKSLFTFLLLAIAQPIYAPTSSFKPFGLDQMDKEAALMAVEDPEEALHTPLIEALLENNLDVVENLLRRGADPNQTDFEGRTPLMLAAQLGNLDMINALLRARANVNAQDSSGNSALIFATTQGNSALMRTLLEHGADPFMPDNRGMIPLNYALLNNYSNIISLLINIKDYSGKTLLIRAVEIGDVPLAQMLLARGADWRLKNNEGKTAYDIALETGNQGMIQLFNWLMAAI